MGDRWRFWAHDFFSVQRRMASARSFNGSIQSRKAEAVVAAKVNWWEPMRSPMNCHDHWETKTTQNTNTQNNKTPKPKPTHTKSKHQHKTPSSDVTVTSYEVKKIKWGDSLVSSQRMQMTTCVPCGHRPINMNNTKMEVLSPWRSTGLMRIQKGKEGSEEEEGDA